MLLLSSFRLTDWMVKHVREKLKSHRESQKGIRADAPIWLDMAICQDKSRHTNLRHSDMSRQDKDTLICHYITICQDNIICLDILVCSDILVCLETSLSPEISILYWHFCLSNYSNYLLEIALFLMGSNVQLLCAVTNYLLLIAYCQLLIANYQLLNNLITSQSHLNSHTSLTP